MTIRILFKTVETRRGPRTRKPLIFEGHIVYCDSENVTVEHSYNGSRNYYNFKEDNILRVETE